MVIQITDNSTVLFNSLFSLTVKERNQSSALLVLCGENDQWTMDSLDSHHKRPIMRNAFPCHDVVMLNYAPTRDEQSDFVIIQTFSPNSLNFFNDRVGLHENIFDDEILRVVIWRAFLINPMEKSENILITFTCIVYISLLWQCIGIHVTFWHVISARCERHFFGEFKICSLPIHANCHAACIDAYRTLSTRTSPTQDITHPDITHPYPYILSENKNINSYSTIRKTAKFLRNIYISFPYQFMPEIALQGG